MELCSLNDPKEEKLRSYIIDQMLLLGYPQELLIVEKQLNLLPAVKDHAPKRRVDILACRKKKQELLPLLMIECKAVTLKQEHLQQLLGYQSYVQAPFLALANYDLFIWCSAKNLKFKKEIPSYEDLMGEINI